MNGLKARLATLPRDSRDTLFQLAVVAWTIAPHAMHLAPWCLVLAAVLLLARARLALTAGPLPSRWTLVAVLVLAVVLTLLGERTLLGKEAGVTMLVVLLALKTLELRARRDAQVVFLLGFFVVLTNFLYSQSPLVALAMLGSVWGLLTALVLAHMPVGMPTIRSAGAVATRSALLGVPLMLALFLLFPRIAPLWGLPQDAGGRTGLSGTLQLGGVAELANDDSIALRVQFEGRAPPREDLYFRGPVLSRFDGRLWTPNPPAALDAAHTPTWLGRPLRYTMTVEPGRLALLPTLEITGADGGVVPQADGFEFSQRADLHWVADRPLAERVRVDGQAWTRARLGPTRPTPTVHDALALPPGTNPRTAAWADSLRAQLPAADDRALVQAVLQHINAGGYTYTLTPGVYTEDHAIDAFWFDRKQGFCEHFASAFVVVMRNLGIPARIVTGYQGADPQLADGWYVVRQSNAHAWAEVWLPLSGWTRADPTAAVAPDRVRLGRSLTAPPGLVMRTLGNVNPELVASLRGLLERMDNRWNQWVLNYSRRDQFDLLGSLGVESPRWEDLAYALIGLLSAVSLVGAAWAAWDRWRQDPWQRLQRDVQARLARLGVEVAAHDPPRTRAAAVRAALGAAGETLARTLDRLDHDRYGHRGRRHRPDSRWRRQFMAEAVRAATPGARPA